MRSIALTGGIACGKTTAADFLRASGAAVFDADAESRALTEPGAPGARAIRDAFGAELFDAAGRLDRRALGDIVFADENARLRLEGLLHPLIEARMADWLRARRQEGARAVVLDIPLLYEIGWQDRFDEVWVLHVPDEEQVRRIMERDGLTRERALARVRSQMPLREKVRRAHHAIDTSGDVEGTRRALRALWEAANAE